MELSDRDRRILSEIEAQVCAQDHTFAMRMTGRSLRLRIKLTVITLLTLVGGFLLGIAAATRLAWWAAAAAPVLIAGALLVHSTFKHIVQI